MSRFSNRLAEESDEVQRIHSFNSQLLYPGGASFFSFLLFFFFFFFLAAVLSSQNYYPTQSAFSILRDYPRHRVAVTRLVSPAE